MKTPMNVIIREDMNTDIADRIKGNLDTIFNSKLSTTASPHYCPLKYMPNCVW